MPWYLLSQLLKNTAVSRQSPGSWRTQGPAGGDRLSARPASRPASAAPRAGLRSPGLPPPGAALAVRVGPTPRRADRGAESRAVRGALGQQGAGRDPRPRSLAGVLRRLPRLAALGRGPLPGGRGRFTGRQRLRVAEWPGGTNTGSAELAVDGVSLQARAPVVPTYRLL